MSGSNCSMLSSRWTWIAVVALGLSVAVGAAPALGDQHEVEGDEVTAPAGASDQPERRHDRNKSRRVRREAGAADDRMLEHMTEDLSLSEKQQGEVKEILAAQGLKRDALREGGAEPHDRGEVFRQMMDLRVETNGQIEAVLDDAQRKKFTAMREERRKRLEAWDRGRRGPGGGPPGR